MNLRSRAVLSKVLLVAAVVPSLPLLAITLWILTYQLDSHNNFKLHWGYYGDYNRVTDAITSIPGALILDSWANGDITLEEFAVTVRTPAGDTIEMFFEEDDQVRHWHGSRLVEALKRRMDQGRQPEG